MQTPSREEKISIDPMELNKTRLLLFFEVEPHSNQYNQVLLTAEQFKKVSDDIVIIKGRYPNGNEMVELETSTYTYTLPDLPETI